MSKALGESRSIDIGLVIGEKTVMFKSQATVTFKLVPQRALGHGTGLIRQYVFCQKQNVGLQVHFIFCKKT